MELTDAGFDHTVLSEFRTRLIAGSAEQLLLDTLLTQFRELGLLKARGRQRTDSTHVLAAVRVLNRLERVGETMRAALNSLAVVAPDWLQAWVPPEWYGRYGDRVDNYHLPRSDAARQALAATIGADGFHLLQAIDAATEPAWLAEVPAVKTLRQVWAEQYTDPPAPPRWRDVKDLPPTAEQVASPYDPEARWSTKRSVSWVGYKVHLTETCGPNLPRLITHMETTPATTPDIGMLPTIHAALADKALLPQEHLVDKGYIEAADVLTSRDTYGVELVGPIHGEPSWQARAGEGFDIAAFSIDWEAQQATCPQGQTSKKWQPNIDPEGHPVIHIRFGAAECRACLVRSKCTKSKVDPRGLSVSPQAQHEVLQQRRQQQQMPEFWATYAARAGVEGTIEQGVRRCDLRQTRYVGLAKTIPTEYPARPSCTTN